MHLAPRANLHRRRPPPSQRFQQLVRRAFVDARSRVADATLPFSSSLTPSELINSIVHIMIRQPGCDRDRSHRAVSGPAFISGRFSASVVKLKPQEPRSAPCRSFRTPADGRGCPSPIVRPLSHRPERASSVAGELRIRADPQQRQETQRNRDPGHIPYVIAGGFGRFKKLVAIQQENVSRGSRCHIGRAYGGPPK